jgi:hypothetical protein
MDDLVSLLEEVIGGVFVLFIFSLLIILFWTVCYYDASSIEILLQVKNIWIVAFLFIIDWIVPSLIIYSIAKESNMDISFLRPLSATLFSEILYSVIIFTLIPYIYQFIELFILALFIPPVVVLIFYKYLLNLNSLEAFQISSIYAFIMIFLIIPTMYVIGMESLILSIKSIILTILNF